MEAERKAAQLSGDTTALLPVLPFHEKITYRAGNKVFFYFPGIEEREEV